MAVGTYLFFFIYLHFIGFTEPLPCTGNITMSAVDHDATRSDYCYRCPLSIISDRAAERKQENHRLLTSFFPCNTHRVNVLTSYSRGSTVSRCTSRPPPTFFLSPDQRASVGVFRTRALTVPQHSGSFCRLSYGRLYYSRSTCPSRVF